MKFSVFCLLFASLLVIIVSRGDQGKDTDHKLTDDDILTKFYAYDANGDGVIDIEEFKNKGKDKVFGPIIDSLAVFVDTDANNQMSYQEYKASYLWKLD